MTNKKKGEIAQLFKKFNLTKKEEPLLKNSLFREISGIDTSGGLIGAMFSAISNTLEKMAGLGD